jgi:2-polyprenyl-3-methyl-5-hydroxy-6-metoxy-1,4-benzoquinol methylase
LVICNQVFEHIRSPTEAARGLFQLVKSRAASSTSRRRSSSPFIAFRRTFAFWRFTLDGASELLTAAGFKVVERRRIGNTALTTGMLLGFGVGDFTPE